jgi:hypothetical protein
MALAVKAIIGVCNPVLFFSSRVGARESTARLIVEGSFGAAPVPFPAQMQRQIHAPPIGMFPDRFLNEVNFSGGDDAISAPHDARQLRLRSGPFTVPRITGAKRMSAAAHSIQQSRKLDRGELGTAVLALGDPL